MAQDLSIQLLKLPGELHHIIIKKCMQQYILPDYLATNSVKESIKLINLLQSIEEAVTRYIEKVTRLLEVSHLYFMTCIDALEERLLEDEWFVWDKSQQCLKIIEITKSCVSAPQHIKIEIEHMHIRIDARYEVLESLRSNIVMMSRMM